jgi:hypothetical protein
VEWTASAIRAPPLSTRLKCCPGRFRSDSAPRHGLGPRLRRPRVSNRGTAIIGWAVATPHALVEALTVRADRLCEVEVLHIPAARLTCFVKGVHEHAEALISIAHPALRHQLIAEARRSSDLSAFNHTRGFPYQPYQKQSSANAAD